MVKIPKNVSLIFSKNKNIIILVGSLEKKVFISKTKIFLNSFKNKIYVSNSLHSKMPTVEIKHLNNYQRTLIALLKQGVLETSVKIYQKLKLVGVGYRVFLFNLLTYKVLRLKLGYSHEIYLKLDEKIHFSCMKTSIIYIYGNFYQAITETSAKLRSCKVPELYKGKGVLYENELIILKKGKKM